MTDTEQQASTEQTSGDEQSQADSQRGTVQSKATEQTSEPKEVADLPSWAQKQIRDARKDAEKARARVSEFEDANKTELEKRDDALKASDERATAAEQRLRDANARSAVTDAATKANATSTRAVYALIRSDLEFDDETGEPTNVTALLKAAQKDEPSLFRASNGSGDGGAGGGAGGDSNVKTDLNTLLRQSMRR